MDTNYSLAFQYIQCYFLSFTAPITLLSGTDFNTSNVIFYPLSQEL